MTAGAERVAAQVIEAAGRAIFSRVIADALGAFHPAYERDADAWEGAAFDALAASSYADLVDALADLRRRFHRALILGGTDAEFADAACAKADAALSRARGQGAARGPP